MNWKITDFEIQAAERLLLSKDCHFDDDAIKIIRCWKSVDVSACPGSGKTTVLLAKLKMIADRMPLEHGAGICVLSHTNVAVDLIKSKMSEYADKLLGYPNYIGTIQSFIDSFITIPFIRKEKGHTIRFVDNESFAQHLLRKMKSSYALCTMIKKQYQVRGFSSPVSFISSLCLNDQEDLCINQTLLAKANTESAKQYKTCLEAVLNDDGILRYQDTYEYANRALDEYEDAIIDLLNYRFQYVFIDEYQDCSKDQREIIGRVFDAVKTMVMFLGDADQAIYNSFDDSIPDWNPKVGFLPITTSYRYNQHIANFISLLRKDKKTINSVFGNDGNKPVLFIYDSNTIGNVINAYVELLVSRGMTDSDGIYKAIGFIRKDTSNISGISIRSYWNDYTSPRTLINDNTYWGILQEISIQLQCGHLYRVHSLVLKLICRIFHYCSIYNKNTGREYVQRTLRERLLTNDYSLYTGLIENLSVLTNYDQESIDASIRLMINTLLREIYQQGDSAFNHLPEFFMDKAFIEKNINSGSAYIDPKYRLRIQFDTVHGVKGETHDATLYLATKYKNGFDIDRALSYCGYGKTKSTTQLFDYCRKVVYVGMSRPRKLLCLAIDESTYKKASSAFSEWEVIDLRQQR